MQSTPGWRQHPKVTRTGDAEGRDWQDDIKEADWGVRFARSLSARTLVGVHLQT